MRFQIVPHTLKRPKMTKSNLTGRDLSVHAVYINVFCPIRSIVRSVDQNLVWSLVQSMIWKFWSGPRSENIGPVRVRVVRSMSGPCFSCPVRSVLSGPVRVRSELFGFDRTDYILLDFISFLAINIWQGSLGLNVSILPCKLKNLLNEMIFGKFSNIRSATRKFIGARGSNRSDLFEIPKWLLNHLLTSKRYSNFIMVPTFNLETLRR